MAELAFDGDPLTAWCPAALPATVELRFARSLTIVLESAWPGPKPGVCVAEITVEAIPWAANPANDPPTTAAPR